MTPPFHHEGSSEEERSLVNSSPQKLPDPVPPDGECPQGISLERPHPPEDCPQPPAKELRIAVIREELVALTGNPFAAVVLNQLLYWTQRVKDFDLLLEEERDFNPDCNVAPRHGWIYKTAADLIEETMLCVSRPTMRKYLKDLIEHGWVEERNHPLNKWNKTTQYRVNLRKLQEDLRALGHTLSPQLLKGIFLLERAPIAPGVALSDHESSNFQPNESNLHSNAKSLHSKESFFPSSEKTLASYPYTETTSETKNKEHTQRTGARTNLQDFLEIWKIHVGQDGLHLTERREQQLTSLLILYFDQNLEKWEHFCKRIKASPFLMGQGARHWRISFDWILEESNLIKVLEGNFDDPTDFQRSSESLSQSHKTAELNAILAAIEEPTWRDWCIQLTHDAHQEPLSLGELKAMASSKFAEFDGRLVWIECDNKTALDQVESLRLKILSVVQKTFPNARNIRTQFKPPLFSPEESPLFINPNPQGDHSYA